ncbi:hypothetical protein JL720_17248 [Aureococcus anophagefferens]|nr:hypothetical protein JL720_17248 [Aureococcus anophagefferens]
MFVFWDCWNIVFRELRLEQGEADSPGADVFYLRGGHHFLFDKLTFDYEGCNTETCDESMHFQSPVTFVTVQRCLFDTYKQNMNIKHGSRLGNYGYDDNYYGIRAIAEGDVLPEVLVEGAYVENFDKIYYHEEGGLIAEDFCNADLSWCAPYDYYRMDPFDCHEIARVRANAGAVVGTTGAPSASPAPRAPCAPLLAPGGAPLRYAPGPVDLRADGICRALAPAVGAAHGRRRAVAQAGRRPDCAWVADYAPRCAVVGDDGSLAADACVSCGGSVAPTLQASAPPSGAPSAAPSAPPSPRPASSGRRPRRRRRPTPPCASAAPRGPSTRGAWASTSPPARSAAAGPSTTARTARATRLYYDDGLGYWFVGPNGCGSHTVAMYAVDGARSRTAWPSRGASGTAPAGPRATGRGGRRPAPAVAPSASTPPSLAPSAAPSLSPRPSGLPTLLPAPSPTTAAPAPAPTTAAPSPAPSRRPVGRALRRRRRRRLGPVHPREPNGVYVSRGDACAGRPFYECLDCAGASALYYDDELLLVRGPQRLRLADRGHVRRRRRAVAGPRGGDVARVGRVGLVARATLSCLPPTPAPSAAPTPAPSTAAPTLSVAPTSPAPSTAPSFGPSVLPAPLRRRRRPARRRRALRRAGAGASAAPSPAPSVAPVPAPSAAPSPAPSAAPVPAPSAPVAGASRPFRRVGRAVAGAVGRAVPAPSAAPVPAPSAAPAPAPSRASAAPRARVGDSPVRAPVSPFG